MIDIAELRSVAKVELAKKDNNSVLNHVVLACEYSKLLKNKLTSKDIEKLTELKEQMEEALYMQYIETIDVMIELLTSPGHVTTLARRSNILGNDNLKNEKLMMMIQETGLFKRMWKDYSRVKKDVADSILLDRYIPVYDMVLNNLFKNHCNNLQSLVDFNNQFQRFDGSLVDDLLTKVNELGSDKTMQLLNDFSSNAGPFAKLPIGYRAVRFDSLENTTIDEKLNFFSDQRFSYDVKKYGMETMASDIITTANDVKIKKYLQDKKN